MGNPHGDAAGPAPHLHVSPSRVLITLAFIGSGAFLLYDSLATTYKPVLRSSSSKLGGASPLIAYADRLNAELCPQVSALAPTKHRELVDELDSSYANDGYRLWAYENLGAAVRVPWVSY